ncbi:MAG: hypothetical protein JO152_05085 [Mycobacteriaceae bacterium]|nr:hypothetical protein [Mycobacteriaceae bacterium]
MSAKTTFTAAALIAVGGAASIAVAPLAAADPVWPLPGAESASATIADLQAQGYDVQINWANGYSWTPLWKCSVSGINNPDRSPGSDKTTTTVYVDVVCPHDDWDSGGIGVGVGLG